MTSSSSSIQSTLLLISGFPSGGTDLIKTILNAHPDSHLIGELPNLARIASSDFQAKSKFADISQIRLFQQEMKRLDKYGNLENPNYDFSRQLSAEQTISLYDVLFHMFSTKSTKIWGSKTPQFTEQIATLLQLFPDAKFLIITRDVRDVCLSWRNKWNKDIYWCASKWAKRMVYGINYAQQTIRDNTTIIKFEDLLERPEEICREICQFLDIPFSPRMLEHHLHTQEQIDGKLNYGQALIPNNLNKWRNNLTEREVTRIEEIAYSAMLQLGYTPEFADGTYPLTNYELRRGQLNDGWALLSVGNRASRQNSFGNRLLTAFSHARNTLS